MKTHIDMVRTISSRETRSYFYSPVAYVVISIFLGVIGWFFFSDFFLRDNADMRKFFTLLPWMFTFIIPAITMGTYAEEHSRGSYEMLVTLPVSPMHVVLGKFLGSYNFLQVMLLPTIVYAISIRIVGDLEWGPVIGGFMGSLLLGGMYVSIGIFASSITKNQIIAFILSVVICFFLTSVDGFLFFLPASLLSVFQYLSANYHFQGISKGIVDTRDVFYFLICTFLFLLATHKVMLEKYNK